MFFQRRQDGSEEDRLAQSREEMVRLQLARRGVKDERVLEAFRRVPRHRFVPPGARFAAYDDHPLAIGRGQTISQPYMVALMTEELRLGGGERVLEIGTGSGYQTAILAELCDRVYSVERIESLSLSAREVLADLGYANISFRVGDGTLGWAEYAPFDRILVTAGAPSVPPTLQRQLSDKGILVVPVGRSYFQTLTTLRRFGSRFREQRVCDCVFVKLVGEEGWRVND
jgi:protein-L-isoaspartate(D-aspartate) O-methyltransferase